MGDTSRGPNRKRPSDAEPFRWSTLVIGSGLAALIAAAGGIVGSEMQDSHTRDMKRCELAAGFLQDETPNPYLDKVGEKTLVDQAAARFTQCMKE